MGLLSRVHRPDAAAARVGSVARVGPSGTTDDAAQQRAAERLALAERERLDAERARERAERSAEEIAAAVKRDGIWLPPGERGGWQ
jgi:hypothetical protein